jgi:succinoglycan biosynthesis transport protein ExoP
MNFGFRIPSKVDTESPDRPFDLLHYLNFAWRNWLFIASVTAFALLVGVIYLLRATPLYTASTQVLLEQGEKPPGLDTTSSDRRFDSYSGYGYLENQIAILRSDSLLRRVVIKELAPPKAGQGEGQNKDDPASAERAIAD